MKSDKRTRNISVRMTQQEYMMIDRAANIQGLPASTFTWITVVAAARNITGGHKRLGGCVADAMNEIEARQPVLAAAMGEK